MKELKKKKYKGGMPEINHHAAGIDAGSRSHFIAIDDGDGGHEVYEFATFTEDMQAAVDLLVSRKINTVAIESTGVYWLIIYLMLEEAGIEPYLVNAKHVKNVTGRKQDDTDAIWLQKLHSCGLLEKSFQPDAETRKLRAYVRHRNSLISSSSDSTRRMQKALELMNIKVHTVIRDLTGKTGLGVVEAMLNGERNGDNFLKFKDPGIKCSDEEFKKSLTGTWNEEYLFLLSQAYEAYRFYREQIESCDKKIYEQLIKQVAIVRDGDISDVEVKWKKKVKKNEMHFKAAPLMEIIFGVDLCEIEGVGELTTLNLLSEVGPDFSKWKESKCFTSWLNLCPNTKITGGKIISSRMQKKKNIAGQGLRQAASTVSRCKGAMGDHARMLKSKLGKKSGTIAMSNKLARIVYIMVTTQQPYNKELIKGQKAKQQKNRIKYLEQELRRLKRAS